jgi:hypothetical protein
VSYRTRRIVLNLNIDVAIPEDFDSKRDKFIARFSSDTDKMYYIYIVDSSLEGSERVLFAGSSVLVYLCGTLRNPSSFQRTVTLYPKAEFIWKDGKAPPELKSVCLGGSRASMPTEFDPDSTITYHDQFRVLIWTDAELEGVRTYDDIITHDPIVKTVSFDDVTVLDSRTAAIAMLGELIRLQSRVHALQDEIGPVMSSLDDIDRLYQSNDEVSSATRVIRTFLRQEKIRIQSAYEALLRQFKPVEDSDAYEVLALKNIMSDLKSFISTKKSETGLAASPRMFSCPPQNRRLAFRDLTDDL